MMNDNYQEYDFSMESLLLRCNKPFHFCSTDTHITFLLIKVTGLSTLTPVINQLKLDIAWREMLSFCHK